jgi:exoribonuclease R
MPRRHLSLKGGDDAAARELRAGFARIRTELDLPDGFPDAVSAEAEAAAKDPSLPAYDLTELAFLTIDPPGSTDLDQAMHIERRGSGYRLRYAIADVGAFVASGSETDAEAHRRGETLYSPDTRTPLHPPVLSEGAASLLPGETRPAVLWTIDLDADGEQTAVDVQRAMVRSRDRLDYADVQRRIDGGTADERLVLLAEVGRLRKTIESERGGISLPIPEQRVEETDAGFRLAYRVSLPVESWNEQVSLLTGMAAADLMLHGEVGVLRTLPVAPQGAIQVLRRAAKALGIDWPVESSYAEVINALDAAEPRHAAFLEEATTLLRGAGYTAFDGGVPEQATHAAVAAEYAHATAPLRRLVDRYVSEVCLALSAGEDVPEWVRARLPGLPDAMAESSRRAGALERECVALMEAVVLRDAVGQVFDGVVVETGEKGGGTVQLGEPAVRAAFDGDLPLGEPVRVRLVEADVERRSVRFAPA